MEANSKEKVYYKEIIEVENVIDDLIKLVGIKDEIIKSNENEINKLKENKYAVNVPLEIINIELAYVLLIAYSKSNIYNETIKLLNVLNDNKISKLPLKNKEIILKCILKYINNMDNNLGKNIKVINDILTYIISGDISDELNSIYKSLMLNDKCSNVINKNNFLLYLIKLFLNNYHNDAKAILKLIINKKYYEAYSQNEIIDILMIRAYYNQLNKVKTNDNISSFIQKNKNTKFIHNFEKLIENNLNFDEFQNNIEGCNVDIAKKLYELYKKNKIEAREIYICKKNKCEDDNNDLKKLKVNIPIYNIKENKKTRILEIEALWCESCNKYYLTTKLLQGVYKILNINEGIKYKSISGLNLMSQLMILGYNTNVNREKRWDLLENRIIPTLGYKKVFNHISFLINLNKNKVSKDYSRSLNEWNYDLLNLKKKYYRY